MDIFFVISGYVITSSLINNSYKNFKSFILRFFERRIKRILPALIVFVLFNAVLISLFNSFPSLSLKTGSYSLFGLSNIYLYQKSVDYFAQSNELNIFANTWSLGVEEQFYLFFPFIFWFSINLKKKNSINFRNLKLALLILTISSIISFIYLYEINQSAAYFLLPMRLWEISFGCLLFLGVHTRSDIVKRIERLSSPIILFLMVGILLLPNNSGPSSHILMVFLTSMFICCIPKRTRLYKLFTNKKIIYIGLISYPLYLWHWSILTISRWTIGIHWWSIPFQVLSIVLLSVLSYELIEKPLRKSSWLGSSIRNILIGTLSLFFSALFLFVLGKPLRGFIYIGKKNNTSDFWEERPLKFKGKFTGQVAEICDSSGGERDILNDDSTLTDYFLENCYWRKESKSQFISFIGDSHTLTLFPMVENLAKKYDVKIFSHSRGGCAFPEQGETTRYGCNTVMRAMEEFVLSELSNDKGGLLITSSYLTSHFGYSGKHRKQFSEYSDGSKESVDKNLSNYIESLKKIGGEMNLLDANLVIFAPIPTHKNFRLEICSVQKFRPRNLLHQFCQRTDKSLLIEQREHIMNALNELDKSFPNIFIYDTYPLFCDSKFCYPNKNDELLYSDDNHLTTFGANFVYSDFIKFLENNKLIKSK